MHDALSAQSASLYALWQLLSRILHILGLLRQVFLLDGGCWQLVNRVARHSSRSPHLLLTECLYSLLYGWQGLYRLSGATEEPLSGGKQRPVPHQTQCLSNSKGIVTSWWEKNLRPLRLLWLPRQWGKWLKVSGRRAPPPSLGASSTPSSWLYEKRQREQNHDTLRYPQRSKLRLSRRIIRKEGLDHESR